MSTESTPFDPAVNNPPITTSGSSGGAISDRVEPPEHEEINFAPCKGFPRRLMIEWDGAYVRVTLRTRNFEALARATVKACDIRMFGFRLTFEPQTIVYQLHAADAVFHLSQREFETLRAKLQPRGVEVSVDP